MKDLLQALEAALLRRTPAIGALLEPALTEKQIRGQLKRAGIDGAIEPILALYTWRNGARGAGSSVQDSMNSALVPSRMLPLSQPEIEFLSAIGVKRSDWLEAYRLIDLKSAILEVKSLRSHAQRNPEIAYLAGRYIPFLYEAYRSWKFAVDIDPSANSRVVRIQPPSGKSPSYALWEAYGSFHDFLTDAIRANESNEPLACLLAEPRLIKPQAIPVVTTTSGQVGKIPETDNPLVLRTDFSNESAWNSLRAALRNPEDEFAPELDFIANPAFAGVTADQLPSMLNEDSSHTFAFIVDQFAMTQAEHPILVVDLLHKPTRAFRVMAADLGLVASNLQLANLDFEECLKATDAQGVYRDLPGQ